ncbi:MAG TPA: NADH-ubiquinone oxidoreductase-F iron-sulfur binding region domain-containing protein [Acidimicrobiales bacterium]|nr:NADH-ubiquinone oxidoreductase-F iron-sulfur binding region domain-containing protein [Acidimicrobiales bacterium]
MSERLHLLAGDPVSSLQHWEDRGGGRGLVAAREMGPEAVLAEVEAAGLRGRGGAGFPTALKWRTVLTHRAPELATPVVVNAAEGEPGTFKDRTILRHNPYQAVEGALIVASALGSDWIIFGLKGSFARERDRLRTAIDEITRAGWTDGVTIDLELGPDSYLYGEETALLEVIDGREPFPRVAPPWRHGIDELGDGASTASSLELSPAEGGNELPPTLVNNLETVSNLPAIIAEGSDWFRSIGTEKSPGTIVVTVTGAVQHDGVNELELGTPLREAIEIIGGGPRIGRHVTGVLSGVSNALLTADLLDTPLTYEDMASAGAGLGSAGFLVFDDLTDWVAVAHGVSRFLAVESCGQCLPCKEDGKAIADALDRLRRSAASADDFGVVTERLQSVVGGARCFLAQQHQTVVRSILEHFPDSFRAHADGVADPARAFQVAAILDLPGQRVQIDERQLRKQPDWTYDATDSGRSPADRINERLEEAEGPAAEVAARPTRPQ